MKKFLVTTYARQGDMFVPRDELVTIPGGSPRKAGALVVALMVMLATPVLVHESATRAHFFDLEGSTGNTLAAGPLDIVATVDQPVVEIAEGASANFAFTVTPQVGSLALQYQVSTQISGAAFCNSLDMSGFPVGASTDFDGWVATIGILNSSGAADGEQCQVDVTFDAYQQGGAPGTEYHDVETLQLLITADIPEQLVESFSLRSFAVQTESTEPPPEETTPEDEPIVEEVATSTPPVTDTATSTPGTSAEPQPESLQDVPSADSPTVEETVVEETIVEEPAVEETLPEEPVIEESPAVEESTTDETPESTPETEPPADTQTQ